MEHNSISSLLLVVSAAFCIPILLHKFNLKYIPVVVAEIIAGIILGKSGLDLVSEDQWLDLLSLLGLIYLMFLSGVEIDFQAFSNKDPKVKKSSSPLALSMLVFVGMLILSYCLSNVLVYFGFMTEPYFMTIILSAVSLGIVVPVLKEKRMLDTNLGQTILLTAVIADFAGMLLFTYYVSLHSDESKSILWILLLFCVVFVAYFLLKKHAHKKFFNSLRQGTIQLGTRGVFTLILALVALSETLGAENILGAFLAGVLVSLLTPQKSFTHQLDSFGYGFLIPIFFVMVGANLDLSTLLADAKTLLFIPILLLVFYIARVFPVLILKPTCTWKEAFGSGILLTSTMSLAIVAAAIASEMAIISESMYGALILVSILTCFISPVVFNKVMPKKDEDLRKQITIVGTNNVTFPIAIGLSKSEYDVKIFGNKSQNNTLPYTEIENITVEELEKHGAFNVSTVIAATNYDDLNVEIMEHAYSKGIKRVITRIEDPEMYNSLRETQHTVFSALHSTRILVKILVENPSMLDVINHHNYSIKEIQLGNAEYNGTMIQEIVFLGSALIVRIFRNDSFILPHGNTTLLLGDKLLVSGSLEEIERIQEALEA